MLKRKKHVVLLLLLICGGTLTFVCWMVKPVDTPPPLHVDIDDNRAKSEYHDDKAREVTSEYPITSRKITSTHATTEDPRKNLRSSYLMKYQPYHFVIQNNFTLPIPRLTLPIYDLITHEWMATLRNYLYQIPPHSTNAPISIVACDSKFKDVLLNWLVSAVVHIRPLLSHVLILSMDQPLHSMLVEHGFDSVLVEPQALLSPSLLRTIESDHRKGFHVAMVLRLTVMRFMNHWGYDAANYDTDAIILKNPEELYYTNFQNSDLIGSRGKFPKSVRGVFGLTLCAGVFMVKSTPGIERFWTTVSKIGKKDPEDQERLNLALTKMNLVWDGTANVSDDRHWTASNHRDFTVTVLNLNQVCRRNCAHKNVSTYYVWHHGGKFSKGKIDRARSDHVWKLRKGWEQIAQNSTARGTEWLKQLKQTRT